MKINKIMLLSIAALSPMAMVIACSTQTLEPITLETPQIITKTNENTTIKIQIKNLPKDVQTTDLILHIFVKDSEEKKNSISASNFESQIAIFKFEALHEETTYKLSKIQFKDQSFEINNSEFTVDKKAIIEDPKPDPIKDPINDRPRDPEKEEPDPKPEPQKDPIAPIAPPKDQPKETKVFSVNIKGEATNKYASEFLLNNDGSVTLNKAFFDITNTSGISNDQITIMATAFDDATGQMSIKVSGGGKENNLSFQLKTNLNAAKTAPYKIFVTKNKTNAFEISTAKTDAQRVSTIKTAFNGSQDAPKIAMTKKMFDYKLAISENEVAPYPHVVLQLLNDLTINEKASYQFDDMEGEFKYSTWLKIHSLKKGETRVTQSSSDNFYQSIGSTKQKVVFPITKVNKAIFDSIKIKDSYKESIKTLFPSFLYAMNQATYTTNTSLKVNLSETDDNYANYKTDELRKATKNVTDTDKYKITMNSLLTSDYIDGVVQWLLTKNIKIVYGIGDDEHSDVQGTFTLELNAKENAEDDSSRKSYIKKLKVQGMNKITQVRDFGEGVIGFHLRFNDDHGKSTTIQDDENWNGLISLGGATSIANQIEKIDSGTKTGWQSVTTGNTVLNTLNKPNEQRPLIQLKYNQLIMNLYDVNKWPFPINWGDSKTIEITKVEYNKDSKKIRFSYNLSMDIKDNAEVKEFTKSGVSTATLTKVQSDGKTVWKLSNVGHDELRDPIS